MAATTTKIYTKDKQTFARLKSLKQQDLLKVPVTAVPFCVRAQNAFDKTGIRTLGDLVVRTRFQLLKIQNMGRLSVDQAEAYLSELGLMLGTPPEQEAFEFDPIEVEPETPERPVEAVTADLATLIAEAQRATAEALKLNERMVTLIEKMAAGGAR